jgi:hypothetical protein
MEDLEKRGHRTRRPTAGPAEQREVEPLNLRLASSCQSARSRRRASTVLRKPTLPPLTAHRPVSTSVGIDWGSATASRHLALHSDCRDSPS